MDNDVKTMALTALVVFTILAIGITLLFFKSNKRVFSDEEDLLQDEISIILDGQVDPKEKGYYIDIT